MLQALGRPDQAAASTQRFTPHTQACSSSGAHRTVSHRQSTRPVKRQRRCAAGLQELLEAVPAVLPPEPTPEPVGSWQQQAAATPHLLAGYGPALAPHLPAGPEHSAQLASYAQRSAQLVPYVQPCAVAHAARAGAAVGIMTARTVWKASSWLCTWPCNTLKRYSVSAGPVCRSEPLAAPQRVALLLSGGVDSSLALRLLQEAGHHVEAFYLQIWFQDDFRNFWGACPWADDLAVCRQVGPAVGGTVSCYGRLCCACMLLALHEGLLPADLVPG